MQHIEVQLYEVYQDTKTCCCKAPDNNIEQMSHEFVFLHARLRTGIPIARLEHRRVSQTSHAKTIEDLRDSCDSQ